MTRSAAVSQSRTIIIGGSKPLLIWIAPWLLIPWGLGALAFAAVVLVNWGEGTLIGAGTTITSIGQLSIVLVFYLAWTGLGLAGGIGLYRERQWARPVLGLAPVVVSIAWGAAVLAMTPNLRFTVMVETILEPLAECLIATWYFYGKRTVTKYYHDLDEAH